MVCVETVIGSGACGGHVLSARCQTQHGYDGCKVKGGTLLSLLAEGPSFSFHHSPFGAPALWLPNLSSSGRDGLSLKRIASHI